MITNCQVSMKLHIDAYEKQSCSWPDKCLLVIPAVILASGINPRISAVGKQHKGAEKLQHFLTSQCMKKKNRPNIFFFIFRSDLAPPQLM